MFENQIQYPYERAIKEEKYGKIPGKYTRNISQNVWFFPSIGTKFTENKKKSAQNITIHTLPGITLSLLSILSVLLYIFIVLKLELNNILFLNTKQRSKLMLYLLALYVHVTIFLHDGAYLYGKQNLLFMNIWTDTIKLGYLGLAVHLEQFILIQFNG